MSSCVHVVECVEDNVEGREPFKIELLVFDVRMLGNEFDIGVELLGDFLCDNGFWFLDVFLSEEKLAIEVGEIDGVEVDNMYFAKASEDEVFEEFATDASGANQEDFGLEEALVSP